MCKIFFTDNIILDNIIINNNIDIILYIYKNIYNI